MDDLLVRDLSITLKFPKRTQVYDFQEPTIYDILKFNQLILAEKYLTAIKLVIPDMNERDFLSNPTGILHAIKQLIYGEQKKQTGKSMEEDGDDNEGFFPSVIDMLANRYGQIPTELIKKITFSQMMICAKGYEWNLNIQNGKEKDNIRILHELDKNDDQDAKDLEKAKKDREKLKKHGLSS